jgi:hypothetical protein
MMLIQKLTRSQAKCFSHELEMRIDKTEERNLLRT